MILSPDGTRTEVPEWMNWVDAGSRSESVLSPTFAVTACLEGAGGSALGDGASVGEGETEKGSEPQRDRRPWTDNRSWLRRGQPPRSARQGWFLRGTAKPRFSGVDERPRAMTVAAPARSRDGARMIDR